MNEPSSGAAGTGDLLEGSQIDCYKILQKIGEGGFGIVYMASQTGAVHRRVALKIIKAGMDTKQVIARFEAERQALAMMDHPNIARVFDAGETGLGRPYFVMELVKGIPLSQFCREENLDTEARLRLFIQVCRAVQHAHLKGVIHRDLKPSNVLVTLHDGEAVPKIIDFGIAKAMDQDLTDKTLFTRYEQMIGTPAYMSPEQAALSGLDVDTRSDVYALGVLLYEILTGTTPFDADTLRQAAFDEMRRIIREDEPPRPSVRLTTLRSEERAGNRLASTSISPSEVARDLDWIVMKAIEKDRGRRYETAGGLAQDVERFLDDEPVEAGPPGLRYKLTKFVRRHRIPVAATAAVVVALVAGLTFATWGMLVAKEEARSASDAREAESAMNEFLLEDLLGQASPYESAEPDLKMRTVLDRASEKLSDRFQDKPLLEAEMRMKLGEVYRVLTYQVESNHQYERAAALFESSLGTEAQETLRAFHGRARTASFSNHDQIFSHSERVKLLEQLLERQIRILGPAHEDTIETKTSLAWNCAELSEALESLNGARGFDVTHRRRALTLSKEILDARQRLGKSHPSFLEAMLLHAKCLSIGGNYWEAQDALHASLLVLGGDSPVYPYLKFKCLRYLGDVCASLGHRQEAARRYRQALDCGEKIFEPLDGALTSALALLLRSAKKEEALELFEERVRELCAAPVEKSRRAEIVYDLTEVLSHIGCFEEATRAHLRSASLFPDSQPVGASQFYAQAALNALMSGDFNLYEECRERMLTQVGATKDPHLAAHTALRILLWPSKGSDLQYACRLVGEAYAALDSTPSDTSVIARALALCQEGEHLQAIQQLEPLISPNPNVESPADQASPPLSRRAINGTEASALAIVSLAYAALRQGKEAEKAFEESRTLTEVAFALGYHDSSWETWAGNCILLNRCEASLWGNGGASLSDNSKYWKSNAESAVPPAGVVTLIEPPSEWRYWHSPDGTDPLVEEPSFFDRFCRLDYDDSHWAVGSESAKAPYGFGYGDRLAVTLARPEKGERYSAYFRHRFTTHEAIDGLWLRLNCDDGVIIYLDGEEEARFAISRDATISHELTTFRQMYLWTRAEQEFRYFKIARRLEPGSHVLAISVHNSNASSSDLRLGRVTMEGLPAPEHPQKQHE